jgi:hypothetical protein
MRCASVKSGDTFGPGSASGDELSSQLRKDLGPCFLAEQGGGLEPRVGARRPLGRLG